MEAHLTARGMLCLRTLVAIGLAFSLSSCRGKSDGELPSKMLPFGGVNSPVSQQIVVGKIDVSGWALSEAGIESVSIYVDRTFVVECATGQPRPDVARTYPKIADSGSSGWAVAVDAARFTIGWHEVTVQVKSKAGVTRDLASLPIVIQR